MTVYQCFPFVCGSCCGCENQTNKTFLHVFSHIETDGSYLLCIVDNGNNECGEFSEGTITIEAYRTLVPNHLPGFTQQDVIQKGMVLLC